MWVDRTVQANDTSLSGEHRLNPHAWEDVNSDVFTHNGSQRAIGSDNSMRVGGVQANRCHVGWKGIAPPTQCERNGVS
jgi:hypothetical protein